MVQVGWAFTEVGMDTRGGCLLERGGGDGNGVGRSAGAVHLHG